MGVSGFVQLLLGGLAALAAYYLVLTHPSVGSEIRGLASSVFQGVQMAPAAATAPAQANPVAAGKNLSNAMSGSMNNAGAALDGKR